jgi:hypothetical protein
MKYKLLTPLKELLVRRNLPSLKARISVDWMKLKKSFCLLIIHLLLLQPVLLSASSSRSESAQSRMARIRSKKIEKNSAKPAAQPAANQATLTTSKSTVATQQSKAAALPTQTDDANSAQTHQARSTFSHKERKSSFEKHVESYVIKTKNSYGLKEASVKPYVDAIHKINKFQKNNNNDILSHVKKSIEPLKNLAASNPAVTKSEAQQQIGMALLLKAAMPLGLQAQEIICEMLHKLDNYISYWREQKHHQISYFFHKNPQKWFSFQKQKKEIEDNLHWLKIVHDDHLRCLAKLAEHESLFNQSASLNHQYVWIAEYLSLISIICYSSQVKLDGIAADESIRFEKLRILISDMLSKAPAHERNIALALGEAKKPGHFIRNWIAYSGLVIGSIALARYAHIHSVRFHAWMDDVKDGAENNWDKLKGNVHDLYDAFMGKDEVRPAAQAVPGTVAPQGAVGQGVNAVVPEGDYNDLRRNLDGRLVELRDRVRRVREELNNGVQNLRANNPQNAINQAEALAQCQAAVAGYQQTRNQLLNDGLVVAQEAYNINEIRFADLKPAIQRVLNSAFADIAHVTAHANVPQAGAHVPPAPVAPAVANHIPAGIIRRGIGEPMAADIDNHLDQVNHFMQHHMPQLRDLLDNEVPAYRRSVPAIAALSAHTMNLANVYLLLYQMDGGNLVGVGADIIGQLGNLIETVEHTVEPLRIGVARGIELAEKGDQIITQNQVTAILAALVPAAVVVGGTLWSANKLYNVFKHKPDFQPMREALVDIGHLLNEEGIEKEPDQAGQAQLDQGKILYLVWKLKREAEHVPILLRDQFLGDVSKLSRSDLDTDKKRVWTADKKLQVIDLMYRTYDFLSPMYVVQ